MTMEHLKGPRGLGQFVKDPNEAKAGLARVIVEATRAWTASYPDIPLPPVVTPDAQEEVSKESLAKIRSKMFQIAADSDTINFVSPLTASRIHEKVGPLLSDGIKLKDLRIPDREELEKLRLDPPYNPVTIKTIRRHSAPYNRLLNRLVWDIQREFGKAGKIRGDDWRFDPTIGDFKASEIWEATKADKLSPWSLKFIRIALGSVPSSGKASE